METKKKILVTGSTFPRWVGDTEPRFVLDLSVALTEYYDVTVLVPAAPYAKSQEIMDGVKVKRYHYFPIHRLETLCYPGAIVPRIKENRMRALLIPFLFVSLWFNLLKESSNFDLIHSHWIIPQGIVQSFFKTPYVVTGHGGDVTSLNKGIMRALKRRCLQKASAVTAVSDHLRDLEVDIAPSVSPTVISMGVDTSRFGSEFYKENYFEQNGKRVVLFAGRLAEKKGVKYLIDAMDGVDNAILYIVGDGPLKDELQEQASHSISEIVFAGSKTHDELKHIYASADVFVAPSVTASDGDQEGLPTTILEAMASGVPVVASDHSGISVLIQNGKNGLLCPEKAVSELRDAINLVLANSELRDSLVGEAQKTAKEYDYRVKARLYSEIFESVLHEK